MKFISVLQLFSSVVHCSGQIPTSSDFVYQGYASESPDSCAFDVFNLTFQSKSLCAAFCAENLLCNAFDACFYDEVNVCRLRYGNVSATENSSSQCTLHAMITANTCPDGFFLRSHGICKNRNLALHSPTSISSVHISEGSIFLRHGNGSLAVNGEVRFDDTECSHTSEENLPFLTIDLLNEFFVGSVIFTNRGSSAERLHDLNVTVGKDGSKFDCFCGFFQGPGTPYQRVDMVCQTHCRGRFVRLQIVSSEPEFLQLCEVEVYSNCNI